MSKWEPDIDMAAGIALCNILGVDPTDCTSITIEATPGAPVTAVVERIDLAGIRDGVIPHRRDVYELDADLTAILVRSFIMPPPKPTIHGEAPVCPSAASKPHPCSSGAQTARDTSGGDL